MAFPTTSLVNNQVHKEGNRSWVYNQTAGAWDQVREADNSKVDMQHGTIGAGVEFPNGHPVGMAMHGSAAPSIAVIQTTSLYLVDSGLEVSYKTKLSSDKSFLMFDFFTSMCYMNSHGKWCNIDVTLRNADNIAAERTYDANFSILKDVQYPIYWYMHSSNFYQPLSVKYFVGTGLGQRMPVSLSSYGADETLYFRIFFHTQSGGNFTLAHSSSVYNLTVTEIKK